MSYFRQNSSRFISLLTRILEFIFWRSKPDVDLEELHCKVLGQVGDGAFNKVYRCLKRDGDNESIVAIKEIVAPVVEAWALIDAKISSLQKLQHENVVRLQNTFSRGNYVYLVYEYFQFDLLSFISLSNHRKKQLQINYYLYQIINAVAYYHAQGILHRDLKPQNILIDYSEHLIKLADFNLTSAFEAPEIYSPELTPIEYRAPELLLGLAEDTKEADMWSVGCIFGEMLTGQTLFDSKSEEDQLRNFFCLLGTPTEDSWPGVTELFSSISSYPRFQPTDLAAKFLSLDQGGLDLLSKLLCLNPDQRISAEDALEHPYMLNVPKLVGTVNRSDFYRPGILEMIWGELVSEFKSPLD